MNEEIKQLWLEGLEDPDIQQATGGLCIIDDDSQKSFCCLGVLTQLAADRGIVSEDEPLYDESAGYTLFNISYINKFTHPGEREFGILPQDVVNWAEVEDQNPIVKIHKRKVLQWNREDLLGRFIRASSDDDCFHISLAECNDTLRLNFSQIAELVREQF